MSAPPKVFGTALAAAKAGTSSVSSKKLILFPSPRPWKPWPSKPGSLCVTRPRAAEPFAAKNPVAVSVSLTHTASPKSSTRRSSLPQKPTKDVVSLAREASMKRPVATSESAIRPAHGMRLPATCVPRALPIKRSRLQVLQLAETVASMIVSAVGSCGQSATLRVQRLALAPGV